MTESSTKYKSSRFFGERILFVELFNDLKNRMSDFTNIEYIKR